MWKLHGQEQHTRRRLVWLGIGDVFRVIDRRQKLTLLLPLGFGAYTALDIPVKGVLMVRLTKADSLKLEFQTNY